MIVATGVGLGAFVTAGEALIEIHFPLRLYLGGATGGFSILSPMVLKSGFGVVGDSGGVL